MPIKNSLAFQLLKITFSIYLIVTVSVTVTDMYLEWLQFEKYLKKDLFELGNSSKKGVVLAMWDLDFQQVDSIAEGLHSLPIVTGIEVKDKKFRTMHGVQGDIANEYDLIYNEDGAAFHVGNMTIYSSTKIVYERIKRVYLFTIINAIIKTLALWFIVLLVGKRLITKPLTILTEYSHMISEDQLTDKNGLPVQINAKIKEKNEIKIMEEAFNDMILKLLATRNNLQELNQNLELKVRERTAQLSQKNIALEQALKEVKTLSGLLPICSNCKKIRDDSGYWNQVEEYIGKHSEAQFSHSICPDCVKELYPDIADKVLKKTEKNN